MRKKININNSVFHEDDAPTAPAEGATEAAPKTEGDGAKEAAPRDISQGAEDFITALQAELEEARLRAEEAEKRILYNQAEFQNFRRRKEEEFKDLQRYSNGELIKSLLPILDNFERALKAAESAKNFEALISGVSGTLKQLQTALQKVGVTPIDAVGHEFNPMFHEAIGHTELEEYPANTVAEEVQRGYLIHDRVLRPTLVKVAQG